MPAAPSHSHLHPPPHSHSTASTPLLSRPLLSLLVLLAVGALLLCLLEVRTLTPFSSSSSTAPIAHSIDRSLSHVPPMSAFRPLRRMMDESSNTRPTTVAVPALPPAAAATENESSQSDQPAVAAAVTDTTATTTAATTPTTAASHVVDHAVVDRTAGTPHHDPWVSPLSDVHSWPPAAPTVSTYRWKSHATPLWQVVVEAKGQTVDLASVAIRRGRIVFYGLSAEQQAEVKAHFEPFMHFDGVTARLDKVEDVTEFVDAPLDWSTCSTTQPNYSFFVTPWMTMLYYHAVCEHLINGYANVRSANGLSQRLQSSFHSGLASSHPRSLFHEPLPPFDSSPDTLSPFTSPHLSADSHSQLYSFTRWKHFDPSPALDLLYSLFDGHVAAFSSLESDALTCFRRIRWGRGVPLHYFSRVYPFPLPASAPVWSSPVDTSTPAAAKLVAAEQLDLYTDIELGRWAGIMIDFHNFVMHLLGRERRVRPQRDSNTHEPLPGSEVQPEQSPRILLITRGRPQGRFIANRECLISAFTALNLTLTPCCDWQAPLSSTIAEFHTADILVGLHGAGFTNLLWMAPGGLVVEIKTHYNPDNNYFHPLSNHMDHAYRVVDGRAFQKTNPLDGYFFTDDWCSNFAFTTLSEWQHKHDKDGRFNNVYGVGNFTNMNWMRKDDIQLDKVMVR